MSKFNTWCFLVQEISFLVNTLTTVGIGNACFVQGLIARDFHKPLLFNRLQSLERKCILVLICSMLQQFRAASCHQQRFQLYHSGGSCTIPLSAMTLSTFFKQKLHTKVRYSCVCFLPAVLTFNCQDFTAVFIGMTAIVAISVCLSGLTSWRDHKQQLYWAPPFATACLKSAHTLELLITGKPLVLIPQFHVESLTSSACIIFHAFPGAESEGGSRNSHTVSPMSFVPCSQEIP